MSTIDHLGIAVRSLQSAKKFHELLGLRIVGEEIVGMAELEADGFIDYFYVHPKWQGKGVGKALLAVIESEATKLGVNEISANVSVTAKTFFLSKGFRILEAKSNVILGHLAPQFAMKKTLNSKPGAAANPRKHEPS